MENRGSGEVLWQAGYITPAFKKPCLVWLSGLDIILQTKGSLVRFPVKAHAWVAGQATSPLGAGKRQLINVSLPLSPPPSRNKF